MMRPSEDCISREWVISFIDAGHLRNPNEKCFSENDVVELVKKAPSVAPKPQKFNRPVTEMLDECGIEWEYSDNPEDIKRTLELFDEAFIEAFGTRPPVTPTVREDCISRKQVIEALGEEPEIAHDTDEEWAEHDSWVIHRNAIASLPPVEPERPSGEWIVSGMEDDGRYMGSRWHECSSGIHFYINREEAVRG